MQHLYCYHTSVITYHQSYFVQMFFAMDVYCFLLLTNVFFIYIMNNDTIVAKINENKNI